MSILDDAIREHLELKRAHGADEAELKRLEDEAFGPPGRPEEPDPFAEAPTQFMTQPETAEAAEGEEDEGGRRRINLADQQEPPPPERAEQREEPKVEVVESIEEPEADAAPHAPAEDVAQAAPPAEEPPAMEHEIVPEPAEAEAPDERQAIAEQPTELFDVEAEMGTEDAPAPPTEAPSPSDEEIVVAEQREEPRLVPVADEEDEEDEEFWSEQRLSDELDQALEAPLADEQGTPDPAAVYEDADVEGDEQARADFDPDTGHEDVLEDTPEFLEDAPEDDDLWFEQKPPKDFDFDD
ncbi:MAG: hypothetical protein ACTHLH_12880 [Solirubrobacterales bacterium]